MNIKLSILVPSTKDREFMTLCLKEHICINTTPDEGRQFEFLIDWHPTNCVGKKRNDLLKLAKGEYIVFVDSDDDVVPNYVSLILKAIESKPDCVAINGTITTNGKDERKWFISKQYGRWFTGKDGTYYRTPNHISPVRRELALLAGFPEISHGEDAEYSRRLFPMLKTETIIEEPIYTYLYRNDSLK